LIPYEQILWSILGAIVYAVGGYFKNKEPFDKQKFCTTLIVGVAIGIIQVYTKTSYEAAYNIALSAGLIAIIENVMKAIYRRLRKPEVTVAQTLAK
jgi:hypothetical protein